VTAEDIATRLAAPEPEARRVAAQEIAKVRGKEAAALLLRALADEDWRVRKEAARVAASVEPRALVVDALVGALHDGVDIGLRNAAVEALVAIGQDVLAVVVGELGKLDADGRKLAIEVLGGVPDPRGARALEGCLKDADPNVRGAAAEALGRAGASGDEARELATAALVSALGDAEVGVVLGALEALAALEARVPWQRLEPLARDPVLRRHALAAAARSREPAALASMVEALGDAAPTTAKDAALLLGDVLFEVDDEAVLARLRGAVPVAAPALARVRGWARDEDPRLRGAALAVLGLARREEDVVLLVDALADDDVAERAELGLTLFGEGAVGPALAASQKAVPAARGASISMMPMLALGHEADVVAQLREALRSAQPDVLVGALKGVAMAGGAAELAVVVPLAKHPEGRVASAALSALFSIASRQREAAAGLLATLDPTGLDAACGCVLIDASARGGRAWTDANLAFLRTSLARGGVLARKTALEALATIGGEAAAEAAAFALADEERDVVLVAVRAMGRLKSIEPLERLAGGTGDPALVSAVLRALGDADPDRFLVAALPLVSSARPEIACAAVEAFGRLAGRAREDGLFAALDHVDPEVVKLALTEVARVPDARALARLGMCLDHQGKDVRKLAGELLGHAGGAGAQALLRARLVRERDPGVRAALTTALMTPPHEAVE
jgi:HEAT repeat protein